VVYLDESVYSRLAIVSPFVLRNNESYKMLKRFISFFNLLIPFLESYPSWVKVLIAIWITLAAFIAISLLFCRSRKEDKADISIGNYGRTQLYSRTKKRIDGLYTNIENEKLNPWVFINTGNVVEVTRLDGKIIHFEGVRFEGTPSNIFWSADFIPPIIEDAIVKAFDQTIEECRKNNLDPKSYIYEANSLLAGFIGNIYNRMADIDRRLRSKGNLKDVGRKDVIDKMKKMNECLKGHYNAAVLLASRDEEKEK